ncbi:MAG: cytochrome c3 family protein [Nitrospirae bacterium]|nr:cytochrome c3 family protein [Nitrospirota bacterium]
MRYLLISVVLALIAASVVSARVGGGDITYEVKHIGNVTFHHDTHVETMGFSCTECHPSIFESREKHKSLRMSHKRQATSCGACHNGKKAFDLSANCYVCHKKEVK